MVKIPKQLGEIMIFVSHISGWMAASSFAHCCNEANERTTVKRKKIDINNNIDHLKHTRLALVDHDCLYL